MKKVLELLVCLLHPGAVILIWIDLATRREIVESLDAGRLEEARRLLYECLARYAPPTEARKAPPPDPGEIPLPGGPG